MAKKQKEIKCIIVGNPDWKKGSEMLTNIMSKFISENKVVLRAVQERPDESK